MAAISAILLIIGFLCGIGTYFQISAQLDAANNNVFIDGTDITNILHLLGNAGAFVISVLIVGISFLAVLAQWLIYGIVMLIKSIYAKNNSTPLPTKTDYQ